MEVIATIGDGGVEKVTPLSEIQLKGIKDHIDVLQMRGLTDEESKAVSDLYKKLGTSMISVPSESIQGRIVDLLKKQCAKGEARYGHTLDDCPDDKFDWKLMAMEELIDLVQYQQKEIVRLDRENASWEDVYHELKEENARLERLLNP